MATGGQQLIRAWRDAPEGKALFALLRQLDDAPPAAVAQALAAPLADRRWLTCLLDLAAAALMADPTCEPALRVIRTPVMSGMILADTGYVALAALVIDHRALADANARKDATISYAGGGHSITAMVKAAGCIAEHHCWHADPAAPGGMRSMLATRQVLADGAQLLCDDALSALRLVPQPEGGDITMIRVTIRTPGTAPVREFCAETGRLLRQASSDEAASRAQMMLTMLRHSGHAGTAAALAEASHHEGADTRWHAMREWLACDVPAALPRLMAMAQTDPDAPLREAARQTLRMIAAQHEKAAA